MNRLTGLLALSLLGLGCNELWGLEDPIEGAVGGGGAGATSTSSGSSMGGMGGMGGMGDAGGMGGMGGTGGCPVEESAGPGNSVTSNGSFESGTQNWTSDFTPFDTQAGSFCGCQAGHTVLDGNYGELRYLELFSAPMGATIHFRVRIQAPDTVSAQVHVKHDAGVLAGTAIDFLPDGSDPEGVDGWRLATGEYVTDSIWADTYLDVAFDSSPGQSVLVDCLSITVE
ncbi:MAG: hypothetical protein U0271_02965 [Polyangiaceae bacterium]